MQLWKCKLNQSLFFFFYKTPFLLEEQLTNWSHSEKSPPIGHRQLDWLRSDPLRGPWVPGSHNLPTSSELPVSEEVVFLAVELRRRIELG